MNWKGKGNWEHWDWGRGIGNIHICFGRELGSLNCGVWGLGLNWIGVDWDWGVGGSWGGCGYGGKRVLEGRGFWYGWEDVMVLRVNGVPRWWHGRRTLSMTQFPFPFFQFPTPTSSPSPNFISIPQSHITPQFQFQSQPQFNSHFISIQLKLKPTRN